jgi:ATP-dependent Clp protease ATP-binding subunit ClpC
MKKNISGWVDEVILLARDEAARLGNLQVTPDHLFLGMVRDWMNEACETLENAGVDCLKVKETIDAKIRSGKPIAEQEKDKITLRPSVERTLQNMMTQANDLKQSPSPLYLLLAILYVDTNAASVALSELYNFDYERLLKICSAKGENDPASSRHETIQNKNKDLAERIEAKKKELDDDIEELYRSMNPKDAHETGEEPEDSSEIPEGNESEGMQGRHLRKPKQATSSTPVLDSYGYDLTKAALADKLDPVVGREVEIERLAQILGRRKKNNPILIGEAGVGKSAIAEGLAIRIAGKQVPRALLNKRIVTLDIGSVVAGTKYRGQFEERMKGILDEIKHNPDVIIFIDELHTLVGAGSAPGSLDAANLLKPALARGEIQCIGATTIDEFRKTIEKDKALERRFQKIVIQPTTYDQTLEILQTIKGRYEKHHNVTYSPSALKACITLSQRYITDRNLPDKAIDVMDEVGSRVHLRFSNVPPHFKEYNAKLDEIREAKRDAAVRGKFEKAASLRSEEEALLSKMDEEQAKWAKKDDTKSHAVNEEDVAEVISEMTNILVSRVAASESEKLVNMADNIRKRIIGQDEAVEKVVRAIHRNRAGLKDPNKPIGSFLFLGPTGVGKTQLAKVLAEYLFDSQDNIIRIDMSEYMEKIAITRLVGAPPGYVGYDEGGQLSESVRRKPYSVVLLDEIEKAHPDVFNLLLQVLDEGRLTDSNGNLVDFRNTVLIMTSNIGSRELKDFGEGVGYTTPSTTAAASANRNSIIDKALTRKFAPEFLNRLDDRIMFNSLTKDDIFKIVDIELSDLHKRVAELGYKLKVPDEVKQFLADVGYDPKFGARPLKRAIQRYIEDPLAEFVIAPEAATAAGAKVLLVSLNDSENDTKVTAVTERQEPSALPASKVPHKVTAV